jgi:hypothetical protein
VKFSGARKHQVVCFVVCICANATMGRKLKVATRALMPTKAELWHASTRFAEIFSGPLPASPQCEAPASAPKADAVYVSSVASLRGAKGALMALGAEAAGALCFFGLWWLWHN